MTGGGRRGRKPLDDYAESGRSWHTHVSLVGANSLDRVFESFAFHGLLFSQIAWEVFEARARYRMFGGSAEYWAARGPAHTGLSN
jgi:hypothetical protein